jgi:hypothetical protein
MMSLADALAALHSLLWSQEAALSELLVSW